MQNRNVELHFTEVETNKKFEDKTFTKFFKRIGGLLQEDDEVYADFTFGMKAYSLSMFIALAYVVKAAENINLRCLLYSQKFTGTDNAENKKPQSCAILLRFSTLMPLPVMLNRVRSRPWMRSWI